MWKANPCRSSNLCPSEPLSRIQVHSVGLQDGEMIGAICPQNVPFPAGCPCSGDVAAAAPSCLSHVILGISLHGGLSSVLFSRLPAQSERSCPISFPWQNSEAPFYHLCPGLSWGKFMYLSMHLRHADLFPVLAHFVVFIKETEDCRVRPGLFRSTFGETSGPNCRPFLFVTSFHSSMH